jgi:uncharacterized glyoxalase superfamily protein PhnB
MTQKAKAIPDGFHTVTPYLAVRDAAKAIDYYKRAFGAVERFRMPTPDGKIAHAEIQIGDSILMLSDEAPEMGAVSPQALKGTAVNIFLYVPDVDAVFQKAVSAGATALMPVADMFWGDRYGKLRDPFGHEWSVATHKEDLTPEQMGERAKAAFSQQA